MKAETSFKIIIALVILFILNILWLCPGELGNTVAKILLSLIGIFFFVYLFPKKD